MRDGIIYDCPHANCRTPIYTGKCSKVCIERYNKQMMVKPMTNADRIRAMSDEELAKVPAKWSYSCVFPDRECGEGDKCEKCLLEWLKQPAEE